MNPLIQLRGALYLLAVVAVCAIPFALAQRNVTKQSVAKPTTIIVVTNTNDSGAGSLRQALIDANDGDTIDFDLSLNGQIITLTSGQLVVDKSVTISGPGANLLAVNGNAASRVFHISPGKTVTISGLTITNGSSNDMGGGILNDQKATLTVSNSTISGNSVGFSGGGVWNYFGTVTVTNTTISGNVSGHPGSGIGGGIGGSGGPITVTNSVISGNSVITGNSTGAGGGIALYMFNKSSPTLTVTNSTISGNSVDGGGGGVWNYGGTMTLTNTTISANSAAAGSCILIDVGGAANIGDTILNAGVSGGTIFTANGGTVTSLGYNLASDDAGGLLTGPGDQINTNPMLRPLQDNGGPTFTHALLPGSLAINAGDPNFTPPPFYDQRGPGYPRVVNGRVDIGSFEVQAPRAAPTPRPRPTPPPRP
jgi:hypothetical protein